MCVIRVSRRQIKLPLKLYNFLFLTELKLQHYELSLRNSANFCRIHSLNKKILEIFQLQLKTRAIYGYHGNFIVFNRYCI